MDKYDRQLRLWGPEGQRRLATTHVLLIHASATGAETLKNLVLPGVQRFTILDDHVVSHADLSNNFFVSPAALGQPRAEVVTQLLLEMNGDVAGAARHAAPSAVLAQEPAFLDAFQLVIATQLLDDATAQLLSAQCLEKGIPLLVVNAYGLLGSLRVQVAEHTILDSKPDPPLHELRLSRPFPALQTYVDGFDLPQLSTIDHAHVPFVVILCQAMAQWREAHADQPVPKTFADKTAFKQLVQAMAWGPAGHEVNFTEAVDNAYKAYSTPLVPSDVAEVLALAKSKPLTARTSTYWFLARALAEFVDHNDGMLPITGVVPDMTASTDSYVALQQLYVLKAKEDAADVAQRVQAHLAAAGLPATRVSQDEVEAFCRNAYSLAVLRTRSIAEELKEVDLSAVDLEEEDSQQSPLVWYLLLRAVSSFVPAFRRYPGADPAMTSADAEWLLAKAQAIAHGSELAGWLTMQHAEEMTRFCEVELHNIAALMGGVASQEAVKLITRQFLPLNHTYVFNGINGSAATYAV
ncbi:hypothetical protein P43SY_006565 [Pythium insidiosum]|uniref:NEDD8-activating enzyme E1 regulatory subunit n=1 Tax=Pythium insidiosum TaxID=114742 RepID=A0AAD5L834_PYTIN|nr:hypothetical protein P43SY_006565 [Pythium insidiosum]